MKESKKSGSDKQSGVKGWERVERRNGKSDSKEKGGDEIEMSAMGRREGGG